MTEMRSGSAATALRAPGVYIVREESPDLALIAERMDVCAFAGVAPRGPAWELAADPTWVVDARARRVRSVAVPVESWADYERLFGSYEGPGLLPHAVAAFFEQGGRRAYVVRIVPSADPPAPEPPACTALRLGPQAVDTAGAPVRLRSRNEGTWGNRLRIRLEFTATPLPKPRVDATTLVLPPEAVLTPGALLRLTGAGGAAVLRRVTSIARRPRDGSPGFDRLAVLDAPPPAGLDRTETVEGTVEITDLDPLRVRAERFSGLGLLPDHPRWVGAVLTAESALTELPEQVTAALPADPALLPADSVVETAGVDRYAEITPDNVIGTNTPDPYVPPAGLDALRDLPDVATLVVPDLYAPLHPPPMSDVSEPATAAGADFAECVGLPPSPPTAAPSDELAKLRLDPSLPGDLNRIISLQHAAVAVAERLGLVVLLDVPPGLRPRQVLDWRAGFDSAYAAAYHGWPLVPIDGRPTTLPPSPYAAGVIAAYEMIRGLPYGPAQVPLRGVVGVDVDGLPDTVIGELHRAGVNVLVLGREGVRVTAARTLSRDPHWRQLTGRRLVTQLERTLDRQLQWAVFEPAGPALLTRVQTMVENLLLDRQRAGAFAGETAERSFFIRIPPPVSGAEEQVICEIGVAPSEPLEFVLVKILRGGDGTLRTESRHG